MSRRVAVTIKQMEVVADRMAAGESLLQITKDYKKAELPSYRSITRSVQKDDRLWEIYRRGRLLQAEFYSDHIQELALRPLPEDGDPRFMNAEVQRRRLEIDTLKWTLARIQPQGVRDKKDDSDTNANSVTITWAGPIHLANALE